MLSLGTGLILHEDKNQARVSLITHKSFGHRRLSILWNYRAKDFSDLNIEKSQQAERIAAVVLTVTGKQSS